MQVKGSVLIFGGSFDFVLLLSKTGYKNQKLANKQLQLPPNADLEHLFISVGSGSPEFKLYDVLGQSLSEYIYSEVSPEGLFSETFVQDRTYSPG